MPLAPPSPPSPFHTHSLGVCRGVNMYRYAYICILKKPTLFCCRLIWLQPPPPPVLFSKYSLSLQADVRTTEKKTWASFHLFSCRKVCFIICRVILNYFYNLFYCIAVVFAEASCISQEIASDTLANKSQKNIVSSGERQS